MRKITHALVVLLLFATAKTFAQQIRPDTAKKLLNSENYIRHFGDMSNMLYRIKTEKSANVVFFGGSITHNTGWRDKVCEYLQQQCPDTKFNFLNAGIPSLGSLPHAFRVTQDVLAKGRVDLMFLESAVNDRGNGTNEQTQRRALEGIIRHVLKTNPYANMVVMAFVDPDKMKDYNAGKIPPEVQAHEDMARMYHLPFINLAKEVTDRIKAGEFSWENDFKNLHPSPFGQEIYFRTMKQLLSVELAKPTPLALVPSFLPKQVNRFAYTNGNYLSVDQAKNLKGFAVDAAWKPADSVHTRPGFVNVPMLVADQPGASFELTFSGQVIGFSIISGPDAGFVKYTIDGRHYPQINLYTQWSKSLHLPWYLILGDSLSSGKHVLKMEISPNRDERSKGTACRIVHFLVNN